jgi:hypothetical protein
MSENTKVGKLIVTGTAKWAKVQEVDRRFPDEKTGGGTWSINVELDAAGVKTVKDAGMGHRLKETEEGTKYIQLKRKEKKYTGELREPPKVIDAETNAFKGLIGNGSKVKVLAYTYDNKQTKKSEAMLDTVQVLELVPYKRKQDFEPVEGGMVVRDNTQDDGAPFDLDLDKKANTL